MTSRTPYKSFFGNTGNPYNMLLASLLLHLIVLAAVIMTVPGASRQLTFGAPYSVALVGPEVMHSSYQETPAQQNILKTSSSDHPVILKRSTDASQTAPIIKKDDSGKLDIEKAISAIKEKQLSSAEDKRSMKTPAAPGTSAAAVESQSRQNDYNRFVWSKVKKNWTMPAALMPKNNVEAIIEVRIAQSGAVEYIGFEKHSGNRYFDESALRAVKKSIPFPPLSGWVPNRSIEIGIRFHSAELR
ncbi:MAG: cell envelope integrity protein TolA [Smithellaceae bacterium]|jgi:TonB family protein|nr:cell envelope integrity protein TolA [Smithellaceae bacterium]